MPTYNVHIYREMRVKFTGIEADSPEAAAHVAADLCTDQAQEVEDCQGTNLSALVDLEGDEDFDGSRTIDFESGRLLHGAREMLAALDQALAALNTARRFSVPSLDTDSYRIASLCSRVIAKAKGGDHV